MAKLYHDIWHGKSEELIAERFKKEKSVHCIVTDPPFGTNNLSKQAVTEHGKAHARKIANDETPEIAIATFKRVFDVLMPKTADDCDVYIFTAYQVLQDWINMLDDYGPRHGLVRKGVLVWEKDGPGMGDIDYAWGTSHEFIIYMKKGKKILNGARRAGVFHVPQVRPKDLIHPHEKPVPLLEMFIKASTEPGDLVVDPFGGSGSTVRAAMRAGRSGVAIEYDETNWRKAKDKLSEGAGMF